MRPRRKHDDIRLFSRKTDIDAVLQTLAASARPLRLDEIRDRCNQMSADERALKRLVQLKILRRTTDRIPGYELDPTNPVHAELLAVLLPTGAGTKERSSPRPSGDSLGVYKEGIAQLFGGKEATTVLLALAYGPATRASVIHRRPNLEPTLKMWVRMGVITQTVISSRRRRCRLNERYTAHRELAVLLRKIVDLYDDLRPAHLGERA